MRKVDFELNFKKDLSNIEIAGVERIISEFFEAGGYLNTCYTSSSSYALISTDELLYHEDEGIELEVSHFAITENNMLIMVCEDEDENNLYFEIEPSDFY